MRCGAFARSRLLLAGRVGVSRMLAAARYFFDVGDEIGLGGSDGDGGTTCEVCAVCFAHLFTLLHRSHVGRSYSNISVACLCVRMTPKRIRI